ncbi:hypothetical protein B0O99DRAFT_694237 [Bisporella sp. PMI_857]|nr:hypothetical protein B0O99DRAFT_694237 [Bisporella sp. PMI_857]
MYDTGDWPKEKKQKAGGPRQCSWSGIGFPTKEILVLECHEDETRIIPDRPDILQFSQDIASIKTKASHEVADNGAVAREEKYGRIIDTFLVYSHGVANIKFIDANINAKAPFYGTLKISRELEKAIDESIGKPPSLEVEQWVTASFLLAIVGQVDGRSQDYRKKARRLAQQQLFLNPNLEAMPLQRIREGTKNDDV